jgi:hypothetical protein
VSNEANGPRQRSAVAQQSSSAPTDSKVQPAATATSEKVKNTYRELRVPRPACWACFRVQGDHGYPQIAEVPLSYWAVTKDGDLVPLVFDNKEGLRDARSYNNFTGFKYDESRVRLRGDYGC